jgi:Ca2+-binding RTX toxin-like protein
MRTRVIRSTQAVLATACLAAATAFVAGPADASSARPSCHGHRATIVGTNGDDKLVGTRGPDVIVGGGGKDVIDGLGGNDWLCGGNGNDTIDGGRGDDHEYGQAHYDILSWSPGDDVIDGGHSQFQDLDRLLYNKAPHAVAMDLRRGTVEVGHHEHDTVTNVEWVELSRFDDTFRGTAVGETVFAGRGDDVIATGGGHDIVQAAGGDDKIHGGAGDDELSGNVGNDVIVDRQGSNTISDGATKPSDETGRIVTGPGRDYIHLGFYGDFRVRAGGGVDQISIDHRVAAASVYAGPGNDTVQLDGSDYAAGVVVRLQDGNDAVECTVSCAGDATVYGGPGSNLIDTQAAVAVTITLGHNASVLAPSGLAIFDFNRAFTGGGDDTVTGSSGDDEIKTRQGADYIDAGDGDDTVDAGHGQDTCLNAEHMISCEITS